MSLSLTEPAWLLLWVPIAALLLVARRSPFRRPLRGAILALLPLLLADLNLTRQGGPPDLWVLADRSLSAEGEIGPELPRWQSLLRQVQPADAHLHELHFAEEVYPVTGSTDAPVFEGTRSRLATALRQVLAQRDPDRPARVLVLTDGYSTEPLAGLAEAFLSAEVPIDHRLAGQPLRADYQVDRFHVPHQAEPGQAFLLAAEVSGPDGAVPYRLSRNGQVLAEGTVTLSNGRGRVRFSDRLGRPSTARYSLEILPEGDPIAANNRTSRWLDAHGQGGILLVTRWENDPLADLLRERGQTARLTTDYANLHLGDLKRLRLIIFNDVSAHLFAQGFLEDVAYAIEQQGLGFVMLGGPNSFGSGGYFDSALDPVLPVSMELREEHRKLATAMVIALDRSGSMSAAVEGGLSKMNLANAGAAAAVALLGEQDAISVLAVDTQPHTIVPMTLVRGNRKQIVSRIAGITSMGGGIYVFEALAEAWRQLENARFGQRHVILFSDAADSENPDRYEELIEAMREQDATISVIALGSPADSDAELLRDIADKGGGRIFFTNVPKDLPALFSQETVTVARSAYIEEPTLTQASLAWAQISDRPQPWPMRVPAYNLAYLRAEANAALLTADRYEAPLVAFWQRGSGRVAAVTFPVVDEGSYALNVWRERADFLETLVGWAAREPLPNGLFLHTRRVGGSVELSLQYGDQWSEALLADPPTARLDSAVTEKPIAWERIRPGEFRATVHLPLGETVRGTLRVGGQAAPLGPFEVPTEVEFHRPRGAREAIRALSVETGGSERLNLAEAFAPTAAQTPRSLRPLLLVGLLLLVLLEALATRFGLRWG